MKLPIIISPPATRATSLLSADERHRAWRLYEVRLVDAVAGFLFQNGVNHKLSNLIACVTPPKELAHVVIDHGEEASAQIAIGRKSQPRTSSAKWHRDRCDDTYPSWCAIGKSVFERSLAGRVAIDRHELVTLFDSLQNLAATY